MKRLLALVAAVGLIGGAVAIRRALDDGSGGGNGNGGGDGRLRIACVRELAEVCNLLADDVAGLEVVVEDAADTVGRLLGGDTDTEIDGWLTLAPWPEIAKAQASGRDLFDDESTVGSTELGVVVWKDRRPALQAFCEGEIGWRCLGDAAGRPFADIGAADIRGRVTIGHPPLDSAAGRLVLGNAVVGFFGTPDVGTNDFANDDAFQSWLPRLESAVGERDPFLRMLQQGPGAYTALGTTHAEFDGRAGARLEELDFLYPAPVAVVPVVLVEVEGGDGDVLALASRAALRDGLVAAHFVPVPGEGDPPEVTGLPPAGALVALARS